MGNPHLTTSAACLRP